MTRVAILDDFLPAQIRANPDEASDFEIVWSGTELARFERDAPLVNADVLIADLEHLGADAAQTMRRLAEISGASQVLVVYRVARRDVLDQLSVVGVRSVRGPLGLRAFRAQMMGVIVRGILSGRDGGSMPATPPVTRKPSASPGRTPASTPPQSTGVGAPSRYTREQLGRLMEMRSSIKCECPHQVASLVDSLLSFERYARDCENRNADDARVHAALHEHTQRARLVMEEALALLVAHENVQL